MDRSPRQAVDGAAFAEWIADACDVGPSSRDTAAALRESWEAHAEESGEPAGSPKGFSIALQKRGFRPARVNEARLYSGIALKRNV